MINRQIKERIRDWWRGYRDTDVAILSLKIRQAKPGGLVLLNRREINVIRAGLFFTRTDSGVEPLEIAKPKRPIVYRGRRIQVTGEQ